MKHNDRRTGMQSRENALEETGLEITKFKPRTLRIPSSWTSEQAFAVYETLDDLINVIWRQYGLDIQHAYKNDRTANATLWSAGIDENDVPF